MSLKSLANQIKRCRACRLSKSRTHAVPGDGNSRAKIMFIGEAPGKKEDLTGKPFQGRAGRFLDELFAMNRIDRKKIFIASIIKCRPPKNRNPYADEIETCVNRWLYRQIAEIKPRLIVTLGNIPLKVLIPGEKLDKVHGRKIKIGRAVIFPTYHPAAGMRFPKIRKRMEEDFKKIK